MLKLIYNIYRYSYYNTMQGAKVDYKFYDIAANLTDKQFSGEYFGTKYHQDDRQDVVKRANNYGVSHLLIAAGTTKQAEEAYNLCTRWNNCTTTIGVHPCRAVQPSKNSTISQYFDLMQQKLNKIKSKLVAIGQCGLDYDRLQYASRDQQLAVFPYHFNLSQKYKLPLYLHNRNTGNQFYKIITQNRHRFTTGVVHSFTGTKQELQQIIKLDLYIGINGCSLKTQNNLEILKLIPLERIMLETDSPYCEIKNTHKSSNYVKNKFQTKNKKNKKNENLCKGRNQPCRIIQVLDVVSSILKINPQHLAEIAFNNSLKLFHPIS